MKYQNTLFLILLCFCSSLFAQESIYFNDFESGNLNVAEYVGDPQISEHISFSVWTNNAGNFEEHTGVEGSNAIGISGNGNKSMFFTIQIEEGYQLDLTGYSFWSKKERKQGSHSWVFLLNDVDYANGGTNQNLSFQEGDFEPTLLNQTGEINVEYQIGGMGNVSHIIDNFQLFGEVKPICDEELIQIQPHNSNICNGDQVELFVDTFSEENISYQWQILIDGNWQDLTNNQNYSNVNDSTLIIENIPLAFNQNIYRCIVTVDGCNEESEQAEINVIALPETEPIIYNN
ncbi:hypothetical protein [Psychroflexus aestuariivivens]|uniref:hypothetical protein n=1 Tax=Psychroflexus aestuariivivens TaxID=1795040 RepID=UPI000FDA457D|nr:hypothetical protein [Psychroflexus aestuariivivens]